MVLRQTLNLSERGIAIYKDGEFLGYENIVSISAEELAMEAEQRAMANAETIIDNIRTIDEAKTFLKRLVKQLI